MVVKTRKQGNSMTITIPSDFNIPSGMKFEAKLLPNGEIVFTPENVSQVQFASDDVAMANVEEIFAEYDGVFKELVDR